MTIVKRFPAAALALFLATVAVAQLLASPAWAQLQIDITRGNVDPLPIAIGDLAGAKP